MGAGPSLGKFLRSMDDYDLAQLVENAYTLEPHRMEKIFALAKLRYHKGQQQHQWVDDAEAAVADTAALLLPTQPALSSSATEIVSKMVQPDLSVVTSTTTNSPPSCGVIDSVTAMPSMDAMPDSNDKSLALGGVKDPMNALWTFEGHPLRELQAADKNPQNISHRALLHQGLLPTDRPGKLSVHTDWSTEALPQREVDADNYPVMYGSCGRDKRYGRCSVCYFRGLRCNTAHYCACCQRSVCIRPRKYPGEEHHKICWNVLHMDKDMIQRVEKKKKRKLQALTVAETTAAPMLVSRVKATVKTCDNAEADTEDSHRQNDSVNHSVADPDRGPSIPAVVTDGSGTVDL